jgi:predicted deacylase
MSWLDELKAGSSGWHTWQATVDAQIEVFCCRGYSSGPLALITAGVHGDEYEGPTAVASLTNLLSPDSLQGTVVAVPVVNPEAFGAGTRLHPKDGRNLARAFPGNAHGGPTEQLASAIFEGLAVRADYIIDLHSGGVEYTFLPVTGFYGVPNADNQSLRAAQAFGLPRLWKLPLTDGVLSYEAWRRGKISIGAEYLGAGQLSENGISDYRDGIIHCLSNWGLLASRSTQPDVIAVFEGDWELASVSGIFRTHCRLGDAVTEGTTLATISGMRGHVQQELKSTVDGVVLGLRSKALINRENWAVLIGKRVEINA